MCRKKYVLVFAILFSSLYYLQMNCVAADARVQIMIDEEFPDQLEPGEVVRIYYMLTGAVQNSEYTYRVKIFNETGNVLSSWKGIFKTNRIGTSYGVREVVISYPLGRQRAEISIPDLQISSTCRYTVVSTSRSYRCNFNDVSFTASLDRSTAAPGDTVTLSVTAVNDMACNFAFKEEYLTVDIQELPGTALQKERGGDVEVAAGAKQVIAMYRFDVPAIPEDEYSINILYTIPPYIELDYTYDVWAANVFLKVEITPECLCEDVRFTSNLDKSTTAPGDTVTLSVTAVNSSECDFTFEVNYLTVDLRKLGGVVPQKELGDNVKVAAGATKIIVEYTFDVPDSIPKGEHIIYTSYKDTCSWVTHASLKVEKSTEAIEPVGTISIVSQPQRLGIDEPGYVRLEVYNPLDVSTIYTIDVSAPSSIRLPQSTYTVVVRKGSKKIRVNFTALEEGDHVLTFKLSAEGHLIDEISTTVTVEEPVSGSLEVVSAPSTLLLNSTAELKLKVVNTSKKRLSYQVRASPSEGLRLTKTSWSVTVDAGEHCLLNISIKAVGHSPDYIQVELLCENETVDRMTLDITVEEDNTIIVGLMGAAAVFAAIGGGLMKLTSGTRPGGGTTKMNVPEDQGQHYYTEYSGVYSGSGGLQAEFQSPSEYAGEEAENFDAEFERAEEYEEIGGLAEKVGNLERAAEYYEKAADLWKKIGKIQKTIELYKKASKIWRQLKTIAKGREDEEKTAEAYEKAGLKAQENGDLQRAAEYYEKAADLWRKLYRMGKVMKCYKKSAQLWMQLKNTEKARAIDVKTAEAYEEAGTFAHQINECKRAAELYENTADLWRKTCTGEKAMEFYRKAAKIWTQSENTEKARAIDVKTAEAYEEASMLAQKAGDLQKATEYFEKAADLWRKTQYESKMEEAEEIAAEICEEAGDKAQKTGDFQKAAEFYEKAADLWRNSGNGPRAHEAEEKALTMYGEIYA